MTSVPHGLWASAINAYADDALHRVRPTVVVSDARERTRYYIKRAYVPESTS